MRSQERRGRGGGVLGWVASAAGAGVVACSPAAHVTHRAEPGGWTDTPAVSAPPRSAPAERWDLAEHLHALQGTTPRARSEHLGGDLDGEVLASAGSGYPLRGPTQVAAVGATLVERLFEAGERAPAVYFVMTKHPPGYDTGQGDWEFLVVARDGAVEERGKIALCSRCHAEAPRDHLFGGR